MKLDWAVATLHEHFSKIFGHGFDDRKIDLKTLIEIHLLTHKSTSNHSMRNKYRSAVYYFSNHQKEESAHIIKVLQSNFENKIITKVLEFKNFKPSSEEFQNYYVYTCLFIIANLYPRPSLFLVWAI